MGCLLCCGIGAGIAVAQPASDVQDKVRSYRLAHEKQLIDEFVHILSIPNLAADGSNRYADGYLADADKPYQPGLSMLP